MIKILKTGPIKLLDLSTPTPYIIIKKEEIQAIKNEVPSLKEGQIMAIFKYLRDREIVHIEFY